ncbi:methyl-accepting chemotaxis protein [Domibacillus sp. PGB-M46]|uniref:methyl-accepting chemotaxis protein n=2 Tax=unclassified Domibacillus TaxID=2632383 RepID=UPI001F5AD67D|nr:methyl-accepting chemotaxis protein [Domibacillus sp. PGB-M46]MCI2256406.1 methyl-accepting chemotaxis protein [Domibacillus sp. PGB-M46]
MNISVAKKLFGGFLVITVLLGLISFISYYNLKKVDNSYADLVDRRAAILMTAKDIQTEVLLEMNALRGMLLNEEEAADSLSKSADALDQKISTAQSMVQSSENKELLHKLDEMNKTFKARSEKTIALMETDREAARSLADGELSDLAKNMWNTANTLQEKQTASMEEGSRSNTTLVNEVSQTILLLSIVSFILALLIGTFITRMITKPISALARGAESIASGDLTGEDIQVRYRDEIGRLTASFNQMKASLQGVIQQVSANAEQVAATSEELSASAEETSKATEQISMAVQDVAIGSEKQAASTSETAQAVEEISAGMHQAAASIQAVADLTVMANEKAAMGNAAVTQTVEQMNLVQQSTAQSSEVVNALGEKSKEIGQIVEFITEIASQTNLLALNAAIEAARAGEQGKGFAVVADEVRKLAEQSANAAGDIRELITEIQREAERAVRSIYAGTEVVGEGISLVARTGEAFQDITASIQQVTDESQQVSAIVEQVNASSQTTAKMIKGVSEISEQAAGNIQNVAASAEEQNAAMEEVSASAEALSRMAQELRETISKFKV